MPQFAYKARRRSGEVVHGVLDVPDRTAALTQILSPRRSPQAFGGNGFWGIVQR